MQTENSGSGAERSQISRWGEKVAVLLLIFVPLVGFVYAVLRAWKNGYVGWFNLSLFLFFYVLTGLGITIGFHRHFTHESFEAKPWLRYALGILGSMAYQGPLWEWVVRHFLHHIYSDKPGKDQHSPYEYGPGTWNMIRGFLHAQCLWLFTTSTSCTRNPCADRLRGDPVAMFVTRHTLMWMLLSAALPFLIGLAWTQTLHGAWMAFLWGGLVRLFLLQHVTWAINSYCHLFGRKNFKSGDESRDSLLFGILAFGEGWHNGHHAFLRSALHGILHPFLDVSYLIIRLMEKLGWVWNIQIPQAPQIAAKRIVS